MNRSYIAAAAILGVVLVYFLIGSLLRADAPPPAAGESDAKRVQVVYELVQAQDRPAILELRGSTEAFREVTARAETAGRVAETPAVEGEPIAAGDVLCRLDVDGRRAALNQAEANLRAAQLDYDAGAELAARGHRSQTQVAALEAMRDAARAQLEAARIELANIDIAAPFDGIFDGRLAEIGDYLSPGQPCGVIVQLDPIRITAEVAERDVSGLAIGMPGQARLVTGETIEGEITFVERRADRATRTFRLELTAPNPDAAIRAGVTSDIVIPLQPEPAHRVPTSVLTLNPDGDLGVRIVEEGEIVRFVPVRLLSDDGEQVWVAGLPDPARVIVLGQDFVADGALVQSIRNGDQPRSTEEAGAR